MIEVRKVKRNKSISDFSAHNVKCELYHPDCVFIQELFIQELKVYLIKMM